LGKIKKRPNNPNFEKMTLTPYICEDLFTFEPKNFKVPFSDSERGKAVV